MIAQQINDYITERKPAPFCDPCIADALQIRRSQANHATRALGTTSDFNRDLAECSMCKTPKQVIARA
jgi:hypothetical protein